MLKSKGLGKYIACALLFAAVLTAAVCPASALTSGSAPLDASVITNVPTLTLTNPLAQSVGRRVSLVHRGAGFGYSVIGTFEDGTRITVLDRSGEFYKVDCFDMKGYIAVSQVRADENGEYYVNCQEDSSETEYLTSYTAQETLSLRSAILNCAKQYIGVPYVTGGETPRGFDCSGFTCYVFGKAGVELNRSVYYQLGQGVIVAREELQCGDLVIFSNTGSSGGFASHIGIYIGNDQIIHASASRGIAIDSLSAPYYTQHYQCARRILLTDLAPTAAIPTAVSSYWRDNG